MATIRTWNGTTWEAVDLFSDKKMPSSLDDIAYGGLTYREIFEDYNEFVLENYIDPSSTVDSITLYDNEYVVVEALDKSYFYWDITNITRNDDDIMYYNFHYDINTDLPYFKTVTNGLYNMNYPYTSYLGADSYLASSNKIRMYLVNSNNVDTIVTIYDDSYIINLTALGIDSITQSEMDELYNKYRFIKDYSQYLTETEIDAKLSSLDFDGNYVNITGDTMTGDLIVEGNVGIGTDSPDEKLHILGTVKVTSDNAAHLILNGDNNNSGDTGETDSIIDFLHDNETFGYRMSVQNFSSAQTFDISNFASPNYTSRFRIDGNGNVGIGTTTPNTKLHILKTPALTQHYDSYATTVIEDTEGRLQIIADNGGANAASVILSNEDTHWTINNTGPSTNNNFSIGTRTTTASGTDIVGYDTDRFVIDNSGNVGIGTTSPSAKLDVNGDASITGELSVSDDVFIGGNQALTTATTLLNVTDGDGTVESLTSGDTLEFSENGNINFDFVAPGVLSVNATNNYADSLALNGSTLELGRSGLTDLTVDLSSLGGGSEPEWEYVGTAESTSTVSLSVSGMSFDDYTYKIVVNAHQDTEVTSTSYYPYLQFLDSAGSVITSYSYASSLMGLYSTNETSQTAYTEYNFLDRYENAIRLGVIPSSPETIYDDTGFYGEFTIAPIFPYYTNGTVNENYGFMLMGQSVTSQGYNLVGQYEAGSTTNLYGHGQAQVSGSFVPDDYDQIVPDGIRVYWYGADDMDVHIYRRANRT